MKKELNEIFQILELTENQKKEFIECIKPIESPSAFPYIAMGVTPKQIRLEVTARLLSEPEVIYLILRFSYPDGSLSIDEFKKCTEQEYKDYISENYN